MRRTRMCPAESKEGLTKQAACELGGGEGGKGVGRLRRMQRAGEGPTGHRWGGARAQRTWNMNCMVVTLDVSKLSDWLNADAYCRVARRAYDAGGMRAERRKGRGAAAAHAAACKARARLGIGGAGHARWAH